MRKTTRAAALWTMMAALGVMGGCGEDEFVDDGSCGSERAVRTTGGVDDLDGAFVRSEDAGNLARSEPVGELATGHLTLPLGEAEFTVAGSEESEVRPRVLFFHTNAQADASFFELLGRRLNSDAEEANELEVVAPTGEDFLCDIPNGQICVRFGFDDTENGELTPESDGVVHDAVGGTVRIVALNANRIDLSWDLELGPNLSRFGDASSGELEGCFASTIGITQGSVQVLNVVP